jgi:serine/threonine protein kinase
MSPTGTPPGASTSIYKSDQPASDDAPTIISRARPQSFRPEELLKRDLVGRRLGHFELLEPIGAGGMAAVIRARDTQLDRTVALKILPPEMAANPESILRFHQEARAAAKLDHENIARVFFCGEDQGLHFIAFEYVEGENLRAHLRNRGRLTVAEAMSCLLQIAGGLAHAAERGIVHRDIKPSNIILMPNGRAKLVDMGLARSLEPRADLALTQSGVTLGTFDYISPEQALEPRDADVRSDIYSLGCTVYHALTGQTPVPDGTAAKKLHHHQSVEPIDPRQLNPEIPNEMAGILARMMAKDPKDRYQRPEDLVQELLQQGPKLGVAVEKPSGINLANATPLSRSRFRFVWVAGAAAVLVVALVVGLGILSRSQRPGKTIAKKTSRGQTTNEPRDSNPQDSPGPEGNPEKEIKPTKVLVHDVPELTAALDNRQPLTDVRLATDVIDLTGNPDRAPGLVFSGESCQLTIEPAESLPHRPVIRIRYDPAFPPEMVWSALTVQKGRVTLRHLRFEVDAKEASDIQMAAVRLQETGELRIEDCEFAQLGASPKGRISSVLVEGPSDDASTSRLIMERCYFVGSERNDPMATLGGGDAITLDGAAWVRLFHCAFGPHSALVHFLNGKSQVEIHNESALLKEGAEFLVEKEAKSNISMYESLISCPDNHLSKSGPALISQKGGVPEDVEFTGRWNCYHDLDNFWVIDGLPQMSKEWPADDQVLLLSPWRDKDPLARLREGNPKQAFEPDLIKPELQFSNKWVGAHKCTWGPVYDVAAAEDRKPLAPGTLIVDPTATKTGGGIYRRLGSAIEDAKRGDTILLKHGPDRSIKVDMIRLEKPDMDLTIKPFEGFHPILTLGRSTDPEAGMFRLHDGKLQLKDLEFLLNSDPADFQSRAVVSVVGDGECQISNCVVTLDKGDGNPDRDFALITLLDTANVMKMEPQAPPRTPDMHIENCFVRGKGEMLVVRSSRPFRLVTDKSLVALDGNFLAVKGSSREVPVQPPSSISLNRVTTYLTQHLIWLRATEQQGKNNKGLVQTQVASATDCLFASATDKSLVHLDGIDNPEDMPNYFTWTENRNNNFSKFDRFLDQQPTGQTTAPSPYDRTKWDLFTHANGARYDIVKFAATPAPESSLTQVPATAFRVNTPVNQGTPDCGAAINDLPVPYSNSGSKTDG